MYTQQSDHQSPPAATMPPGQAPWKHLLQQHISHLKPPVFSLATLASQPQPNFVPSTTSTPTPSPRVRTMIHRGFLGTLPENRHNPLSDHNPDVYESDLFTFTTDARTAKAGELGGPRGGAEVEQCFWVAETQNQWRVRGRCYLLAEHDADEAPEVTDLLMERMRQTPEWDRKEGWSWKKEVQAHFGNLAPGMRGSFANPPPGVPLEQKSEGRKGVQVENQDVLNMGGEAETARKNFRLGVVVPEVVERVDLREDSGKSRRWVWWWVGEGKGENESGWEGTETWP
jgi:pyridoxamine 5'-phosphate oxidase